MSKYAEEKYLYGPKGSAVAINLTAEERALAASFYGNLLASALQRRGEGWFTPGSLGASAGVTAAIRSGEALGLWRQKEGTGYLIYTEKTSVFIRAALAIEQEKKDGAKS